MKFPLLIALLLLISCSAKYDTQNQHYYWASDTKYDGCVVTNYTSHGFSDYLKNVHQLQSCKEVQGGEVKLFNCHKNDLEVRAIISKSKDQCTKFLEDKYGILPWDSKSTYIHKGGHFLKTGKKLGQVRKLEGKQFWSYGYLRKADKSEVLKYLGQNSNTPVADETFLI